MTVFETKQNKKVKKSYFFICTEYRATTNKILKFNDCEKSFYIVVCCNDFSDSIPPRTPKIRRRTAQPQDLLFGDSSSSSNDQMTRSYQQLQSQQQLDINRSSFIPLSRVPSAPGSLK